MSEKKMLGLTVADIAAQDKLSKQKRNRLKLIKELIDFSKIEKILKKKYKYIKNARGQSAYPPLLLFKILFLQNLYNLSDYEIEECLYDRLSFMDFVGLSMEDIVPDHSTICRFRQRLIKDNLDKKLFEEINRQLLKHGLQLEKGVIVDATIIEAKSHPSKYVEVEEKSGEERKESDKLEKSSKDEVIEGVEGNSAANSAAIDEDSQVYVEVKYSSESEANWLTKGKRSYYGYKAHVVADVNGFILCFDITGANVHEVKRLGILLKDLESKGIKVNRLFADKGYSSEENRNLLRENGIEDFIMHKKPRCGELREVQKKLNELCRKIRYRIERSFGTLKTNYGLFRFRYKGLRKVYQEFLLKSMCFNVVKALRMSF